MLDLRQRSLDLRKRFSHVCQRINQYVHFLYFGVDIAVVVRLPRLIKFRFKLMAVIPPLQISNEIVDGHILNLSVVQDIFQHFFKGVFFALVVGEFVSSGGLLVELKDVQRGLLELDLGFITHFII